MDNLRGPNAQKCPRCGRLRSEWRSNNSEGFSAKGATYCCEGCATGGTCTCTMMQSTPRLEKNVLDTSDAKAKGLE
jgi:hypothetical protein